MPAGFLSNLAERKQAIVRLNRPRDPVVIQISC